MAGVSIDDILQAELWTSTDFLQAPELDNIVNSGLLATSRELSDVVNSVSAGSRFELPFVEDTDYSEPDYMDDSDNGVTINSASWKQQLAVLTMISKSYGYANIVDMIAQEKDPAGALRNIIGNFWGRDLTRRVVAILAGISAKAGDGLTLDVADDSSDGADVLLDPAVIIDGVSKLGDMQDKFNFIFLHSKVYADLKKQNIIQTMQPSETGAKPIELYGNLRVIVNDLLPVEQGTNKLKYTTIVAQTGTFAYADKNLSSANGMPPLEAYRDPTKGRGAGKTTLIARRGFAIHPIGWTWNKAGFNPTLADLGNKNNWTKEFKAKDQRFVKIVTN